MQAEVLSVGTELLLGQTVNTDTTIVAKALSALGIDLLYAAVVGDNVGRLEKAVYDALDRSDILITTGGLGPTGDDLTKETVAAAAGWMQMDWSGIHLRIKIMERAAVPPRLSGVVVQMIIIHWKQLTFLHHFTETVVSILPRIWWMPFLWRMVTLFLKHQAITMQKTRMITVIRVWQNTSFTMVASKVLVIRKLLQGLTVRIRTL